jgi:hypothetical protein
LAWDSSLMQMAEVAYEVRNEARWIVGSEESPPEEGYPTTIAAQARRRAGHGRQTLGVHFARDMVENYRSDFRYPIITPVRSRCSKLEALRPAVDRLGAALLAVRDQYAAQIQDAYEATDRFALDYYSTYPYYDLVDFGAQTDWCRPEQRHAPRARRSGHVRRGRGAAGCPSHRGLRGSPPKRQPGHL